MTKITARIVPTREVDGFVELFISIRRETLSENGLTYPSRKDLFVSDDELIPLRDAIDSYLKEKEA